MPKIVWEEKFSVGVKEIDEQHKKWISIINDLHDSLISGQGFDEITGKSLKAMADYAAYHFAFEEDHMKSIGYPDLEEHRKIHRNFMERIHQYQQDDESGKIVLNTEIMKVLMDWLTNHILTIDQKYTQ